MHRSCGLPRWDVENVPQQVAELRRAVLRLGNVPLDSISVIIHPQSIIHSMVEFADGSVKAQMSPPDMRLPIQYALTWPERQANADLPVMDFRKANSLTFEQPDVKKFPCLSLAIEAGQRGGTYPAALCAADEVAVELFLDGDISEFYLHFRKLSLNNLVRKRSSFHSWINQPLFELKIHKFDKIICKDKITNQLFTMFLKNISVQVIYTQTLTLKLLLNY